jgi:hypothetical protein
MKFNTHANTKECRPCQRATATTEQTTNNKTKQTPKYLFIALRFCFLISVGWSQDVAQRLGLDAAWKMNFKSVPPKFANFSLPPIYGGT